MFVQLTIGNNVSRQQVTEEDTLTLQDIIDKYPELQEGFLHVNGVHPMSEELDLPLSEFAAPISIIASTKADSALTK